MACLFYSVIELFFLIEYFYSFDTLENKMFCLSKN